MAPTVSPWLLLLMIVYSPRSCSSFLSWPFLVNYYAIACLSKNWNGAFFDLRITGGSSGIWVDSSLSSILSITFCSDSFFKTIFCRGWFISGLTISVKPQGSKWAGSASMSGVFVSSFMGESWRGSVWISAGVSSFVSGTSSGWIYNFSGVWGS